MLIDVTPKSRVLIWRGDPLPRTSRFCSRANLEAFYGEGPSHHGSRPILVSNGQQIGFSGYSDVDWAGVGLTTSRVFACMVAETSMFLECPTGFSKSHLASRAFLMRLVALTTNLGGLFRAVELDLGSVPRAGELAEALNEYDKKLDESRPGKSAGSYTLFSQTLEGA